MKKDYIFFSYKTWSKIKKDPLSGLPILDKNINSEEIRVYTKNVTDSQLENELLKDEVLFATPEIIFTDYPDISYPDISINYKEKGLNVISMEENISFPFCAPFGSNSWGLEATKVDISRMTGKGVKVAFLDDGLNLASDGFSKFKSIDKIIGYDFISDKELKIDDLNYGPHGTQVASIICSEDISGEDESNLPMRIGIAKEIDQLIFGKILNSKNKSSLSVLINALLWSASAGANIINISSSLNIYKKMDKNIKMYQDHSSNRYLSKEFWSLFRGLKLLEAIINYITIFKKTIIVAAAGNDSFRNETNYFENICYSSIPAICEKVISVGSISYSNEEYPIDTQLCRGVDILAPGDSTCSIFRERISFFSNTSAAAAHVSGILALWIQKNKGIYDYDSLVSEIKNSTSKNIEENNYFDIGSGLIQAP